MNILLINPPCEMLKQEGFGILPPLGLLYIGSVLKKAGHRVKILDCVAHSWNRPKKFRKAGETIYRFDVEDGYIENLLSDFKPEIVGIANLFATTENICVELAKKIKAYTGEVKIIIGGTNASVRPKFFLGYDFVDFVISGEGEYIFKDFADSIEKNKDYTSLKGLSYKRNNNAIISPDLAWIENLDELPFPSYDLLEDGLNPYFQGMFSSFFVENRILTMATSRGCIHNCYFCSGMKYLGRWRGRSPENVIEELVYLKKDFKIKEVAFLDANINLEKERFVKIMDLMLEYRLNLRWSPFGGIYVKTFTKDLIKPMKETGCHSVDFAVEHGNPNMQKFIGKIAPLEKVREFVIECKKEGLWSHGYFVVGLPGETTDTLNQCLEYAKSANFDSISLFIGTPVPGSRFYDDISGQTQVESENLRYITKNIFWTELDSEFLTKTIKKFMLDYSLYKITNELKPYNLFLRVRSLSLKNVRLYIKIFERFFKNLIFR